MLYFRQFRFALIFALAVSGAAACAGAVFDPRSATMALDPSSEQKQDNGAAPDADLAQRLAQAQIVVSGVVLDVAPFGAPRPGFISEHAPVWWQATIQVESVEKGTVTTKTIPVLYDHNTDPRSNASPKIAKGDHGVWLLQDKDTLGESVPVLAVVQPLDRHPIADLAKLRALLKTAKK